MSLTVTVTIDNQLGKTSQDPTFTLRVLQPPTLTAGSAIAQPQDVPNTTSTSYNGGIYSNTTPGTVRGIACYTLPDNQTQLVIFFDESSSRLMLLSSESPEPDLVDIAERDGELYVKGSFIMLDQSFDYQVGIFFYRWLFMMLTHQD